VGQEKKMAVINTNAKALFSQAALKQTDRGMTIAMQQLSTGKRINSARDDAAGLSIVTRMTEQIRGLNQAVRNANDAINLIQTAEGATNEITDMMQRMRELAVQAVNDTNSNADRSYLDLEFQQLKQQIVQISDNTEWNGFSVLNGTAGQRVGEMPLYKVTSVNQFGSVFIQPTTSKTITGTDAGEVQQVALTGTPAVGVINIAGVDVNITSSESTLSAAGSKIATTLNNSDSFVKQGITASYSAGTLTLNYSAALGDVPLASVSVGSTGLTATATTTRLAATQASETFANNGKFLQSGAIQFDIASGAAAGSAVTATFTNPDNKKILMTGTLSTVNPAVVNFNVADGLNSQVITDNLSYGLLASDGSALNLTATPRALSMTVGVQGSIPTLRDGDLLINGVNVGPSLAADDILSPRNNAAGSAIAKAAAINRVAVDQGISQGEIQSLVFSGTPMPGTITVGGVNVALTSNDNTPELAAAKIAAALQASPQFNSSTGRVISYAPGSPTINVSYPVSEGNVANIAVESGATGLGSVVNTTQPYATKTAGTGVFAKVNENVFSGQAMTGGPVATGVVFINGYASADISTVYNNAQATRDNVVRAINLISDKTGVKAIDTGSDDKGIQLLAVDGRNIEVRFQTSGSTNNISFGQRIGMREGVQSSTISLESKVDAPVVLTGSASGDITRAGLVTGNYTKNEAVLNTKSRAPVDASAAQVSSVTIAGTGISTGKSITTVVNGTSFTVNYAAAAVPADNVNHTVTITSNTPQAIRDAMASLINATATLGVYATAGSSNGELQLTARTPGVAFTMTASTTETSAAAATVATAQITANQVASTKSLSSNDLVINGVNVRPATAADDKFSNTVVSSSDPAASAIALAAAINDSTSLTGVKAYANPAQIAGTLTTTATPVSGKQSLWVNGTEIQVDFVQNESVTDRRAKVVAAINERTGQHGVTASDNGQGVTLITKDGRNLSVWFDSSQKDLDASDFGLDKGGSVAQISKIAISGVSTGDVSVMINGVTVSTTSLTASSTAAVTAAALRDAINANTSLKNVTASLDSNNNVIITSNVPGSAFDLRAPTVAATSAQTLTLSTVSANSRGNNDVSAVDLSANYKTNVLGSANAPLSAMNIRTVYGTVRLVASAPILPTAPGADGLTPSSMNADGRPILIQAGTDGFGSMSNFSALGFNEGTFGGRASEDMAPPKVGRLAFQVGSGANQVVTIDLADFGKKGAITGAITGDVDLNVDQRSVRINTREGATAVLNLLDTAMDKVNATRATMGAVMNRLDHVVNNLTNVSMNMSASRSQIQDSDYAQASTDLAKSQIMQQAATAVLAQANTSQQSVLKLLGG
jgi:flagellin